MAHKRTLWLIPARSGSTGLPHKNIRQLGDKPLLAWRIETTKPLAHEGSAIWLSTDSPEYARIGKKFGAEVPFLRPAELSTHTASSVSVCLHAMAYAQNCELSFDYIGLLQPTSPFIKTQSLVRALNRLDSDSESHSAVAVAKVHKSSMLIQPLTPYLDTLAKRFASAKSLRRQDIPNEIAPCGGFFIAKWHSFLNNPTFYTRKTIPILVDEMESIDIDSEFDFLFALFCLERI